MYVDDKTVNKTYRLFHFFSFSALGTIGAFFVCTVTTIKYFDGNYTLKQHHTK